MEDDDLEYDITFPSPVSAVYEDDDEGETGQSRVRKEPVVILLGWLGCKEKHIAKYGQIYDQIGCITIKYTAPKDVAFFNVSKLKDIACKVLDLLDDYSVTDNPIFFHIFSNNGSYVYENIVRVLTKGDERYQKLQVRGMVIDSAPGKPRLSKAAMAFAHSLNTNIFVKYIMVLGMICYLIFTSLRAWFQVLVDPSARQRNEHFLFDNMADDPTRWPQLFLYSKGDKIILYQDIEDMIQRRRKLGVDVRSLRWEETDHVSHFRVHPSQYSKSCADFVAYCLGEEIVSDVENEEESFQTDEEYLLTKKQ